MEVLLEESVAHSIDSPAKDTTDRARFLPGRRAAAVDDVATAVKVCAELVPMKLVFVAGGVSGSVGGVRGAERPGVAVTRRGLQLPFVGSALMDESRLSWLDLPPPPARENIGEGVVPSGLPLDAAVPPRPPCLCRPPMDQKIIGFNTNRFPYSGRQQN